MSFPLDLTEMLGPKANVPSGVRAWPFQGKSADFAAWPLGTMTWPFAGAASIGAEAPVNPFTLMFAPFFFSQALGARLVELSLGSAARIEMARDTAADAETAATTPPTLDLAPTLPEPKSHDDEDRLDIGPVFASDRPAGLPAPRQGGADDLKAISGIGPKIEATLHGLGIYHYDQIAAWQPAEIDWVDDYMKFSGRIVRDGWVEQAEALATGGVEAYKRRFGKPPR